MRLPARSAIPTRRPVVLAALLGIACGVGPQCPSLADDRPRADLLSAATREAARLAGPGVVTIGPGVAMPGRLIAPGPPEGGSGVVVDADRGLILTLDSIVAEALDAVGSILVELPDGRIRPVIDVRRDPRSDLALVSIDPQGLSLRVVEWGDPDPPIPGTWVLALGRPPGIGPWISAGVASGTGRAPSPGSARDLIRTDRPIPPGASGGALIDLSGALVGITLSTPGGPDAVGFAIPSDRARRVAEDLGDLGRVRRSSIGVVIAAADPELVAALGLPGAARVDAVAPSGPADRGGVLPDDLILSVGNRPVSGPDGLVSAVEFAPIGEPLPMVVLRGSSQLNLELRPEPTDPMAEAGIAPIASAGPPIGRVEPSPTAPDPAPPPIRLPDPPTSRDPSRFPALGLRLDAPSAELVERFGLDPGVSGLVIVGTVPGGPADLGGLSPGMVITDVLDRRVSSLATFREAVAVAPPGADLILRIVNRGRSEFRVILRDSGAMRGIQDPDP
ncbi:trypsin-like peptidase domain-containing protein [Tautonia plasticadhaerens]|uniref:Periplasmic serine endoprotease DegP n=1 Tax=Tautonia plasticadhaerens TaxID=2527974 RepID=A0A518GXN9_9BACT|nr:trypsin-like peptidase domain-containing protein [Tautonia plasticadhaerens]QDV33360.1 Periplasmic serine endoprotease DegP precursor [Tautonia plasticadhaerens]